jgi:hypothetical protein
VFGIATRIAHAIAAPVFLAAMAMAADDAILIAHVDILPMDTPRVLENVRGPVAVGQRASLILLEKNPLEDLDNLGMWKGFLHQGRWWSFDEIEDRLAGQVESSRPANEETTP